MKVNCKCDIQLLFFLSPKFINQDRGLCRQWVYNELLDKQWVYSYKNNDKWFMTLLLSKGGQMITWLKPAEREKDIDFFILLLSVCINYALLSVSASSSNWHLSNGFSRSRLQVTYHIIKKEISVSVFSANIWYSSTLNQIWTIPCAKANVATHHCSVPGMY